jgi:hypothetical protein
MSATCAACAQPIVGGRFVLAGSEVLHKSCAIQGRKTVLWKEREAAATAVERARSAITAAENSALTLAQARRDAEKADRDHLNIRHAQSTELARLRQVVRTQEDAIANLQRQLGESRAAQVQAHPVVAPTETDTVVDYTAARFSLLEFD